jgi:hypothetical protein
MTTTPEPGQPTRPRQVTLAASLVMAASVLLVASVFERLADLRSVENRQAVENFLSQPPGSDLGLGTESVLDLLYTVSMVAAGLATAAAILGFHVLKRNRGARVGLTILALPLFLCGLVTGGFLASVVAASVAMLWLTPSRHWFDGTTPAPAVASPPAERPSAPAPPPAPSPPPGPHVSPDLSQGAPPAWAPYAAGQPWLAPPRPVRRPNSMVAACILTWVCCALAALLSVLLVAVLVADADELFAEMHRQNPELAGQGVTDATLRSATWLTAIVCLLWSLASSALAVLAFVRKRWAAIALIVSAGAVAMLCLAGSLVSPPLAVPGLLAAATAGLLLQPSVQRWLTRREPPRGPWGAGPRGPGMM